MNLFATERIIVHLCFRNDFKNWLLSLYYTFVYELQLERGLFVLDFCRGSVVRKPIQFPVLSGPHPRRRERAPRGIVHDLGKNILLAFSRSHERDFACVVNDRIRQRYPLGRWFWRIVYASDPSILFGQQLVAWEQRSSVPVRPKAEQDEVEDRKSCRVPRCELQDQLLLVRVGELFEIVKEAGIDVMDVF